MGLSNRGGTPGVEPQVVLDNFSTHSKKDDRWLTHPGIHFYCAPANASCLN
ncbi:MAG: hypothetical protein GX561_14325 [Lentisphaerae bacterium]|jgi:hypothetical protein|nr:hypothetical protein [Lentisphaerota bacterium]